MPFPDFPGAHTRDELLDAVRHRGSSLRRRRIALVSAPLIALAVVPLAVVAARSSTPSPAHVASHGPSTTAASPTTTTPPTTTTRRPAAVPTTAPAVRPCVTGQLSASAKAGSGAGGHLAVIIVFRNISSRACTMTGYPFGWFVDAAGGQLTSTSLQEGLTQFGGVGQGAAPPPATVRVSPGAQASATAWFADPAALNFDPNYCGPKTTAGIRVTAPGAKWSGWPPSQPTVFAPITVTVCSEFGRPGNTGGGAGSTYGVGMTTVVAGAVQSGP